MDIEDRRAYYGFPAKRDRYRQYRRLRRLILWAGLLPVATVVIGLIWFTRASAIPAETGESVPVPEPPLERRDVEVRTGSTFGLLMEEVGLDAATSAAIFAAAGETYDLTKILVGRKIGLLYDRETGQLHKLVYRIGTEEMLHVNGSDCGDGGCATWQAERRDIPYEVRRKVSEGTVESSLYLAGLTQGLDERAIIALAEVFQWDVDFALDVRQGDSFRFIHEERYLGGEYVMPGRVLAAKYVNDGTEHLAFWFEGDDGAGGHYDEEGNSVQRIFLKAPVHYKYISSGFTTGQRYIQAFNISTGHRAIDYATPTGTPIRSVGDGTVVYAGWKGAYGLTVSIRHNETYTTNYCHQSRVAVGYGQKVKQGDVIGYVGSTGLSTGPHLHYEMVKRGVKINPLTEEFPPGEAIREADRTRFLQVVGEYRPQLQ